MLMKFTTVPTKKLAASITASSTTFSLNNIKKWDGNDLVAGDFGTRLFMVLRNDSNTVLELTEIDPDTIASSSITFLKRGLSFDGDLTTETAALKLTWVKNQTACEIGSNPPQLLNHMVQIIGAQTIAGIKTFSSLPATTAGNAVSDNDLVRKAQLDAATLGQIGTDKVIIAGNAGETITDGDLIYFDTVTNNEWMLCDADTAASVDNVLLGIAQGAGTNGNAITGGVLLLGIDDAQSGMTIGDLMYASETAGGIISTPSTLAYLTGGTAAQSTAATWAAITDASFRISIDGTAYNVDVIDFTGDAAMSNVAATIQVALRAATSGSETVTWDTDHFIITSATNGNSSEVSVTSTSSGTVGTDISGVGTAWMDCESGIGTATPPKREVTVGIAKSATELYFNPRLNQQLTEDQQDALAGTSGTPSSSNKYVTSDDVSAVASSGKIVRASGTKLPALSGEDLTSIPPTKDTQTAGETINGATLPVACYMDNSDDEWYACDGNDQAKLEFQGFAITNGTDGNDIDIQFEGIVSGFSALTKGAKYYIDDTGALSTTIGTYEIYVGLAISTTEILIDKGRESAMQYIGSVGLSSGSATNYEATGTATAPTRARFAVFTCALSGAGSFGSHSILMKVGANAGMRSYYYYNTNTIETVSGWSGNTITIVMKSQSDNGSARSISGTVYFYR